MTLASFDIIGDLCFSEPFGCLEERSATSWATAIPDLLLEAIREQSIRLIFGVDNFLQRLVTLLLPAKGRLSKMRHFQKSKEKTSKRRWSPGVSNNGPALTVSDSQALKTRAHSVAT